MLSIENSDRFDAIFVQDRMITFGINCATNILLAILQSFTLTRYAYFHRLVATSGFNQAAKRLNQTILLILQIYSMQGYSGNTLLTNDQSAQLELFISARSLYDMDVFSKSDPYVRVYSKKINNQWFLLGRTETVDNNLNPNFQKSFVMNYVFQARQDLKFEVMDEDDKTNSSNDDFIGSVETSLGACAGAKDQTLILPLTNKEKGNVGKIILRVEPVNTNNAFLRMEWGARKLMNTDSWFDWWDKSDPYLKFLKIRQDNTLVEAARTPVIQNNLDPNWPLIEIGVGKLVRADNAEQRFKVECWDWQEEGEAKHQFIGQAYIKLSDLLAAKKSSQVLMEIKLSNPKHKNPGSIVLKRIEQFSKPTFIDYLRGGLQLNLSVAVDFTGSNGVVTHPTSLHYLNQYSLNNYQQAIMAIGNILLNYDYDKRIPAFGFGAKLRFPTMSTNIVSHCFPLSGNPQQIEAFGLDGLMTMYRKAQTHVQLSGPTYFAPIIKQFVDLAYQSQQEGSYCYQVLLILTDGAIHDMDQTVNLLVNNCKLPLSIIIVGIGNADFSNMNTLDGDNGLYNSNGVKAARDIVQFVPFNQVQMNPDLLARQLLAQLPDQVVQYMTMMGKQPNPPQQVNIQSLMMDNQNVESIEAGLKQNLPLLFANLTVKPEG